MQLKYTSIWLLFLLVSLSQTSLGQDFQEFNRVINTPENDFHPAISPTGDTLIFASNRYNNGGFSINASLVVSYKDSLGDWQRPKSLAIQENFEVIEFPFFTYSGASLYFAGQKQASEMADIWVMTHNDSTWNRPEALLANINTDAWEASPSLSADGRTLYFIRYNLDQSIDGVGYCGKVWKAEMNANKTWSNPIELPNEINQYKVYSLCILPDNKTLIFTAEDENGKGGLDFYKTILGAKQTWSKPTLINTWSTSSNESSIAFTANQKKLYLGNDNLKNSNLSNWNIYELDNIEFERDVKNIRLYGQITDYESKEPISASLSIMRIREDKKEEEPQYIPVDEDGKFEIELEDTYLYFMTARSKACELYQSFLDLSNLEGYSEMRHNIMMVKKYELIEFGETMITLNNVQFDYNSAKLKNTALSDLDKVVLFMTSNPEIKLEIGAHTDNEGTREGNLALSELRAKSVKEYLVGHGIAADRLEAKAYGDTKPLFANRSPKAKSENRRVEFALIGEE